MTNKIDDYDFGIDELGQGASSTVYKAKEIKTGKYCCLKQIEEINEDMKNIVNNEINILNILKKAPHSNVLELKDFWRDKDSQIAYIVTNYYNGMDLLKFFTQLYKKRRDALIGRMDPEDMMLRKGFNEREVQYVMRQVIEALAHIHKQKIVHRDLKLNNIMMHYDDKIPESNRSILNATYNIIDFGISDYLEKGPKVRQDRNKTELFADPKFLNDEKLNPMIYLLGKQGKTGPKKKILYKYDYKLDIWSMGIICFFLFLGHFPYSKYDFDKKLVTIDLERLKSGDYSMPIGLKQQTVDFIHSMIQYDDKKRPSAEELLKMPFLTMDSSKFTPLNLSHYKHDKYFIYLNAFK